jgi:hypothetical protein
MIFEGGERMPIPPFACGELISKGGKSLKVTMFACGELFTLAMAHSQLVIHAWVRDLSSKLPLYVILSLF